LIKGSWFCFNVGINTILPTFPPLAHRAKL
jgi:hypothetical protein